MRTPVASFAGHVGKYAKIALVAFYAIQLAVLFREQIVHFYRSTISVDHADGHVRDRTPVAEGKVKTDGRPRIDAASMPVLGLAIVEMHHDEGSHIGHGDEKKDRARRHRREQREERFIENLFARLKNARPPEGSMESHGPMTTRTLEFAAA